MINLPGVRFQKSSLAICILYSIGMVTNEIATMAAFGKRTPGWYINLQVLSGKTLTMNINK